MEIEGTYTLQATPNEVWDCLADQQLWTHSDSGIEHVERTDAVTYLVTIRPNQAALSGTFTTHVTITEQHAPYYCRLTLVEDNTDDADNSDNTDNTDNTSITPPKTLNGYGILHLNQQENHTIVAYKGDITSHVLDAMGEAVAPLVVKGAVKLLLQQFFTTLSERVYVKHRIQMNGMHAETLTSDEIFIAHEQRITIPSPLAYPDERAKESIQKRSRLRWFIHLLHIGKGNPAEEIRWTQRIRRYSIASVLLFLVWVGTRIPRR